MSQSEMERIAGGKQLTWKQYMKKKADYERQQAELQEETPGELIRAGVCPCGHKSFKHRLENHELIRICPKCGNEKVV